MVIEKFTVITKDSYNLNIIKHMDDKKKVIVGIELEYAGGSKEIGPTSFGTIWIDNIQDFDNFIAKLTEIRNKVKPKEKKKK